MSWRFWAWTEKQWVDWLKANGYLFQMMGRTIIGLFAIFGLILFTSPSLDFTWIEGGERFGGFAQGLFIGAVWAMLLWIWILRAKK